MERANEHILTSSPYEQALKTLRRAMKHNGLAIAAELPLSDIVRAELGVGLNRCTVLLVYCPFLLLEAMVLDGKTASLLPVHIAVSESGTGAVISVPLSNPPGSSLTSDPIVKTFERALRVAKEAAVRPSGEAFPARGVSRPVRASGF